MVAPLSRIEVSSPVPIVREAIDPPLQGQLSNWRTTCCRVCRYSLFVILPLLLAGFTIYSAVRTPNELDRAGLIVMAGFCVTISVYMGNGLRRDDRR